LRGRPADAGYDLACVEPVELAPGAWASVGTGIAVAIPLGRVGLVCPRSGLAARHGVTLLNTPGIIDAGYRGELVVILINHGHETFAAAAGDRVAQLVIVEHWAPDVIEVDELPSAPDDRGTAGFGSSGR
jgi:dUTP pyrophosphatase